MNSNLFSFVLNSFREFKKLNIIKTFNIIFLISCIDSILEIFGIGFFLIIFSKLIFGLNFDNIQSIAFLNDFDKKSLLIGFVIFYFLKVAFSALIMFYFEFLQADVYKTLRLKIFKNFINKPLQNIQNLYGVDAITHINSDTRRFVTALYISLAKIFRNLITLLIVIAFMIFLDITNLFIIIFILVTFLSVLLFPNLKIKLETLSSKERKREIEILDLSGNLIKNLRDIKNYQLENDFVSIMKEKFELFKKESLKIWAVTALPKYAVEVLIILTISLSFFISNYFIKDIEQIAVNLSAISYCFIRVSPLIIETYRMISSLFLSNEYLINFKKHSDNLDHSDNLLLKKARFQNKNSFKFKEIKLQKISYSIGNKNILIDSDLNILQGKNYFIYGKSGIGKSLLLDILSLFRNPQQGKILINGNDDESIKHFYSKQVTFIHQNLNILNNKNIAENIVYGKKYSDEDLIQIKSALVKAGLSEFSDNCEKYILKGDIQNISEGQKKRLALARAFYFKKKILFLDEFTSNLDEETEEKILNPLISNDGYTIVNVSHNVKNISLYDSVYQIKDFKINLVK